MSGLEESEPQDHLLVLAEKKYLLNHDPSVNRDAVVEEMMKIIQENS